MGSGETPARAACVKRAALACTLALLGACTDPAGQDPATIGAARSAPTTEAADAGLRIAVDADTVSLDAHAVPLRAAVRALARAAGLEVVLQAELAEPLTLAFAGLEVPAAVARLLRDHSYALHYAVAGTTAGRAPAGATGTLWVFATGDAPASTATTTSATALALEALVPALADGEVGVRREAIGALGEVGGAEAVAALATVLQSDDPSLRADAAYALAAAGGEGARVALARAVHDPEDEVREAAIEALAQLGDEQAALALGVALADPDVAVRTDAVAALGEVGGDAALDLLRAALADPAPRVREAARQMLDELVPGAN